MFNRGVNDAQLVPSSGLSGPQRLDVAFLSNSSRTTATFPKFGEDSNAIIEELSSRLGPSGSGVILDVTAKTQAEYLSRITPITGEPPSITSYRVKTASYPTGVNTMKPQTGSLGNNVTRFNTIDDLSSTSITGRNKQ